MSNPDFNSIPLSIVERVEIQLGSGTVLYGDNATGGVINIITKKSENFNFIGTFSNRTNDSFDGDISFFKKVDNFNFKAHGSYGDLDGYRDNSNIIKKSYNLSLNYKNENGIEIILNNLKYEDRYGLSGHLSKSEVEKTPTKTNTPDDYGKTKEKIFNYELILPINNKSTLSVNVTNKSRETFSNITSSYGMTEREDKLDYLEYEARLKKEYSTNSYLITGVTKFNGDVKTLYPAWNSQTDYKKDTNAYFFHNNLNIGKYSLIQAYRNQKSSYHRDELKNSYKNDAVDLGIAYDYSSLGNIYVNYSKGFRTPNTNELFDNNLVPQKNKSFQIGLKDYILYSFLQLNLFNTETEDEIFYDNLYPMLVGTDYEYQGKNRNFEGENRRIGVEINAEQNFGLFTFKESFNHIKTKILNGIYKGKEIPMVPENKFTFTGVYNNDNGLTITYLYRYITSQYSISDWNNEWSEISDYSVNDIKIKKSIYENFNLYLGINNLLDKNYITYGTYGVNFYPGDGRNSYLKFEYKY